MRATVQSSKLMANVRASRIYPIEGTTKTVGLRLDAAKTAQISPVAY